MTPGRIDYDGDGLSEDQLLDTPYAQARAWVDDAVARAEGKADVFEPLAISVATVDDEGRPNVRMTFVADIAAMLLAQPRVLMNDARHQTR
jgi:pyridoxamine 5'-phosphate oxidase